MSVLFLCAASKFWKFWSSQEGLVNFGRTVNFWMELMELTELARTGNIWKGLPVRNWKPSLVEMELFGNDGEF